MFQLESIVHLIYECFVSIQNSIVLHNINNEILKLFIYNTNINYYKIYKIVLILNVLI